MTLFTVRAQVTMYIPAETAHAAEVKFEQALEYCGTDASAKDVETVGQEEIETQPNWEDFEEDPSFYAP